MFINLDRYVKTLTELKISANQFLLCYLLYVDQRDDEGRLVKKGSAMANLYKYATRATPWSKSEVRDLVDKGYLRDPNYRKDKTHPDYLEVTDKFCRFIFTSDSNFEELWNAFPTLIDNFKNPNGPRIKLKVCDKHEMRELYKKRVRSQVKHEHVMKLVKWAVENDEINFNFQNFIRGELWETLEELRKEGSSNVNMQGNAAK